MLQNNLVILTMATTLWLLGGCFTARAQVQIAPTTLFMGDKKKTERLIIHNSSDVSQEINIELLYGYPAPDESGEIQFSLFDPVPDSAFSAAKWIRVYPRHLVLPPHQQQVVRLSARPPEGLPAGEYWAHPAISISAVPKQVSSSSSFVSTHIRFIKRTLLALKYRHQQVQTGISLGMVTAEVSGNQLYLWAELTRKGNAAYLGDLTVSIYRVDQEVFKHQQEIAVYHSQKRRFILDTGELSSGVYKIRLNFSTTGRAARQPGILTAPPASTEIELVI